MSNDKELNEIKESLHKLELEVERLTNHSKFKRSSWVSFMIGFAIVFVIMSISIGVIQFISAGNQ